MTDVYYHGSPNSFDTFDYRYIRTHGTSEGVGFYFTNNKDIAKAYGENGYLYKVDLNIKKPIYNQHKTLTKNDVRLYLARLQHAGVDFLSNYGDIAYEGYQTVLNRATHQEYDGAETDTDILGSIYNAGGQSGDLLTLFVETLGYDHIIAKPKWGNNQQIIVALSPKSIKILNKKALG